MENLGIRVSSVMTLRGGKEGVVGHYAWHLEFIGDLAEVAGQYILLRDKPIDRIGSIPVYEK
jgi:hypothetical protein